MPNLKNFIDEPKTARDEARLQIHLASKEGQDEWGLLEKRWHDFRTKSELAKSADELGGSLK